MKYSWLACRFSFAVHLTRRLCTGQSGRSGDPSYLPFPRSDLQRTKQNGSRAAFLTGM